jgi:mannan endo-1,4-beta-mannosidase
MTNKKDKLLIASFVKVLPEYFLLLLLVALACSPDKDNDPDPDNGGNHEPVALKLVDPLATEETRALYSNLWKIQVKGFMFGHHDDLLYGRDWMLEQDRSDVKDVCGNYPAVYSLDFAEIMDDRHATAELNADRKRTILEARRRGEVIIACAHLNNPLTGGDAWDNSSTEVASSILDETSEVHTTYKTWLDRLAAFVTDLKDDDGRLIPIIFRPYHEHTQTWSWWGKACTTQQEFISLWRFTVDYLINDKGVHNLIFAVSPQMDVAGSKDGLLFRWPGDAYVDFLGMDSYNGTNTNALSVNVNNLAELSREKKKPCGITETGIEGIRSGSGVEYSDYWTKQILTPIIGKDISMLVMWRNKYDPAHESYHFFGPWTGHSSAGDFVKFYESPFTLFSTDLPDMYKMAEGVTVE